ncbi:MAG: hypothetical protein GF353_18785 [Candidatus Lokiarchaeota archaeon]|nr:hypothetical protein [Candidatus Lokiarchaeota archaeon]
MPKSLMRASLTFFLILSLSLPCLGRYYDAGIGRFLIPDPHADNYPSMSPYHYCLNDPINKIDPNGLDTYNVDENGDVTVQEGHWWNPWSWKHGVFSDNVTMTGETYKMSDVSVVTQNYIGMKLADPAKSDAIQAVSILEDPIFIGLTMAISGTRTVTDAIKIQKGAAIQSNTETALAARVQVKNGATLYRLGTTGKSAAAEAQFWSLEHPLTAGFASRYGIPSKNVINANFIETATLKQGSKFITRTAPGVGSNVGGGIEVVVPLNSIKLNSFSIIR